MLQVLREILSGSNKRLSPMRIMMMIGLVGRVLVMTANTFGWGGCEAPEYSGPLTALFAGISGGKAIQSHAQKNG